MSRRLQVASMFTSQMVLQQGKPVPVWGTAAEGACVTVAMQSQSCSAAVRDGCWMATLAPLEPGGPFELLVQTAEEQLVFEDILVGEVWVAAGQSNMEQQLLFTEGGIEEAESGELAPDGAVPIRFFVTPQRPFEDALVPGWHFYGTVSEAAVWQRCTPASALRFSAIGYYFARRLYADRRVPIGIISCVFGGTPIEAWIDERQLAAHPELRQLLEAYRAETERDEDAYEAAYADYVQGMVHMIDTRGDIEGRIRRRGLNGYRSWVRANPLEWPVQPRGPKHEARPGGLFRAMVRTVAPYAVRGVLWYQGESNAASPGRYAELLQLLIANWRSEWGEPELPFLVVQLPPYKPDGNPAGTQWAEIREAQRQTAEVLRHVSVVVALDAGEASDIHPVRKRPIAERLAWAALADVYGEPVEYEAPRCVEVTAAGSALRLLFDDRGGGLRAADGNKSLTGFALCGSDGIYHEAQAELLDSTTVEVRCEAVGVPCGVRYAWADWPAWSLYGRNGVPVGPFRR